MDIFYKDSVNAGTMVVVSLPKVRGQANIFFFNAPAPQGRTFVNGAIITEVSYGQAANAQFQQSVDNTIYVYSFGDQMGQVAISGVVFPRLCANDQNGIQELLKFYSNYRVSKSVQRVRVTFANEVIEGFLVSMQLMTADNAAGIHRFVLTMATIPSAFQRSTTALSGGSSETYVDEADDESDDLEGEA